MWKLQLNVLVSVCALLKNDSTNDYSMIIINTIPYLHLFLNELCWFKIDFGLLQELELKHEITENY